MIKEGKSYPNTLTVNRWARILKDMKEGFDILYERAHENEWSSLGDCTKKEKAKIEKSFDLFKEYFEHLWD